MYEKIKREMKEIIEIVEMCPEELKETCFQTLLKFLIQEVDNTKVHSKNTAVSSQIIVEKKTKEIPSENENNNSDVSNEEVHRSSPSSKNLSVNENEIKSTMFHMRIRRMFEQNKIDYGDLENIYYVEDGKLEPLYETIGTDKMSEAQLRLGVLLSFEKGYADNNLSFTVGELRESCKIHKCYDSPNFIAVLKRKSDLFDGIERFSDDPSVKRKLSLTLK